MSFWHPRAVQACLLLPGIPTTTGSSSTSRGSSSWPCRSSPVPLVPSGIVGSSPLAVPRLSSSPSVPAGIGIGVVPSVPGVSTPSRSVRVGRIGPGRVPRSLRWSQLFRLFLKRCTRKMLACISLLYGC